MSQHELGTVPEEPTQEASQLANPHSSHCMPALLTDDAVNAVLSAPAQPPETAFNKATADMILDIFLRYHATEGREALVEEVEACLRDPRLLTERDVAEAVVTALLGGPGA